METHDVTAEQVQDGDYLLDFDNGYVFETVDPASNVIVWKGSYYQALDNQLVYIGFHDAEGNENYLILRPNHPIRVGRE